MIFYLITKDFFYFLYYQASLEVIKDARIVYVACVNILEVSKPTYYPSKSNNTIMLLSLEVPQYSNIFWVMYVNVGLFIIGGVLFHFVFLEINFL